LKKHMTTVSVLIYNLVQHFVGHCIIDVGHVALLWAHALREKDSSNLHATCIGWYRLLGCW
jgi:hypothetical protein